MEPQNKLEMQYAAKRDAHASEIQDLKQQLDIRSNEVRTLNATIDSLKSVNEELKVSMGDPRFSFPNFDMMLTCMSARICRNICWH